MCIVDGSKVINVVIVDILVLVIGPRTAIDIFICSIIRDGIDVAARAAGVAVAMAATFAEAGIIAVGCSIAARSRAVVVGVREE